MITSLVILAIAFVITAFALIGVSVKCGGEIIKLQIELNKQTRNFDAAIDVIFDNLIANNIQIAKIDIQELIERYTSEPNINIREVLIKELKIKKG